MRVLVTGATGFVGQRLVPALQAAGHDVVALVRNRGRYDPAADERVVEGNLLDASLRLPAVDAAYYLVHSMGAGPGFAERDRRAAHNFAAEASEAAIERVVYLGGLGEGRDSLSPHLRSRREVEHVLREGTYDLTTLRAAIVVGSGSASFELLRQTARRLPVMVTPRWVRTRCQPIAVADVLAYLVGVLDVPETAADTFDVGGPAVLTYEEMLRAVARRVRGRAPVMIRAPVMTPRLSAYWLGLVTDVPTSVAYPLVASLKNPVVVRDDRIRSLVPVDRTDFETAVDRALAETADETTPVPVEGSP